MNQSPVNQSPVNQLPVNQLPVNQSPVNQSPVNQLPVNQSPVNQSGVPSARVTSRLSRSSPARSVTPRCRRSRCSDHRAAGVRCSRNRSVDPEAERDAPPGVPAHPLPAGLRPDASPADAIRFADIDFSNSPLGSLPAMTLALGQLPLSAIGGVDWCALFSGPPLDCATANPLDGTTSLLSAALDGAPVNQSPVNQSPVNQSLIDALDAAQAPVNQLPVNQLPVNQLPVNQLPVNQSRILSFPVNQLPVNQLKVDDSPVNQLSLGAIVLANAPVNQSPINQLPVNQLPSIRLLLDCTALPGNQCTGTLGDYVGKVRSGVTLGDLRRALAPDDVPDTWTIANLEDFGNLIVGDLLESLPQPNVLTLADVLALALFANNPQSFAFETLNIFDTSLSLYADPLGTAPYTVAFTLEPNGGSSGISTTVNVSATLPPTFAYAAGTSKLVQSPGTCGSPIADPVVTQLATGATRLTWGVTGTVGNCYTLCFTARPGIVLGPHSASGHCKARGRRHSLGHLAGADRDGRFRGNLGQQRPGDRVDVASSRLYLSYLTSSDGRRLLPLPGARGRHPRHVPPQPPACRLRPRRLRAAADRAAAALASDAAARRSRRSPTAAPT